MVYLMERDLDLSSVLVSNLLKLQILESLMLKSLKMILSQFY